LNKLNQENRAEMRRGCSISIFNVSAYFRVQVGHSVDEVEGVFEDEAVVGC